MHHFVFLSPDGYRHAAVQAVAQRLGATLSVITTMDELRGMDVDLIIWHTKAYPFDVAGHAQLKQTCARIVVLTRRQDTATHQGVRLGGRSPEPNAAGIAPLIVGEFDIDEVAYLLQSNWDSLPRWPRP